MISAHILRLRKPDRLRPTAKKVDPLRRREFSRLIGAAVINSGFCRILLDNPAMAIKQGFQGECFSFNPEEVTFLASIRAPSLENFATQVVSGLRCFESEGRFPTLEPSAPKAVQQAAPAPWIFAGLD